jgi:hypothetical protein
MRLGAHHNPASAKSQGSSSGEQVWTPTDDAWEFRYEKSQGINAARAVVTSKSLTLAFVT